jgi:hypothetical protein
VIAARLWICLLSACSLPVGPPPSAPHAACALPDGLALQELDPRERALALRRLFACEDLQHGRISQADYAGAVAAIDAEWRSPGDAAPPRQPIAWASSVRGFSTQYGAESWAATQALGEPNVFPQHGDIPQAWASLGADDRPEWIEVGFDQASAISAVVVYETYNPGAIARVALISEDGAALEAPMAQTAAATPQGSVRRRFELACTPVRVQAVRLELDSMQVLGWNEIDAIGIAPCAAARRPGR